MNLLDEQQQAFDKLKRLKVGALFMEPGTGKTLTAAKLVDSTDAEICIWLTPFQNKANIEKELVKCGMKTRTVVVGIETLSSSIHEIIRVYNLADNNKSFVVCDESLKIKNADAKRTENIIKIGSVTEYKLILNGTPLSKNIMDLWSQFEFLSPNILKMTHQKYKDTFVEYVSLKNKYGKVEKYRDFHNLEYLHSIIEPFVFESKLNLDVSQEESVINYHIGGYELEDYQEEKSRFIQSIFMGSSAFFAGTTNMQIAYTSSQSKVNAIKSIADTKTIIFARYVETAKMLTRDFPNSLVLTYGKGSFGLNLQHYNKVIFFDKIFDYAQLEQAKRRVYRLGQTTDVKYYMLTGDVGLEKIFDICINKKLSVLNYFKSITNKDENETKRQLEMLL